MCDHFSVSVSNMVNIDRYNPHKLKLFAVFNNLQECKRSLEARKPENCFSREIIHVINKVLCFLKIIPFYLLRMYLPYFLYPSLHLSKAL